MIVKNMTSSNGNSIVNQFIIEQDNGDRLFQSYNSIIAKISNGQVFLDTKFWNHSTTTAKYRNIFLMEKSKDTQKKINSGEYKLTDLN